MTVKSTIRWGFESHSFWLTLSIVSSLLYSVVGLWLAFTHPNTIQDDARQHVFWMQRFLDPELFPNDLIADYFQSLAPLGYSAIYRGFAAIGVHPLLLNKLLPSAIGLATTVYCYRLCLYLVPVPAIGGLSAILLNQILWLDNALSSGTARAFVYVLLLAFCFYYSQRRLWGCSVVVLIQTLIYPPCVLISGGMLVVGGLHAVLNYYLHGMQGGGCEECHRWGS